ncbi:hypothetical protein [Sinanaerobacter chloroacetimidivorans]|jgi:hypothetical protein|uniref:Uncharacterized protein n=1 Tax=Sinanaerobacter chloroacetimidivorans TaxID=2818044 RepID=A0A8J8B0K5_9FIRM|nr:hypothetical protein [Sinanaerobacter chloroacetimidivorans]MBR0596726.1 hypothetical protein [Sinanaerobacter chloroacetimidivorans]
MLNYITINQSNYITYEQMNLINEFRKHYVNLSVWSRALAISLKFNLENTGPVYERLQLEALNTYLTLANFYGNEATQEYLNLLTQQIILYRSVVEAMLNNDTETADRDLKRLYDNSELIGDYFARLSPYWDKEQWVNLQRQYIDALYSGAFSIVQGDYQREIEIFDRMVYYTNLMADYTSRGIMRSLTSGPPIVNMPENQCYQNF